MSVSQLVNAILGCWLFASAFLWEHSEQQFFIATVGGSLIVAIAFACSLFPSARHANALVAALLWTFTLVTPTSTTRTRVHDVTIAVMVLVASLAPDLARAYRHRQELDDR